MMEQPNYQLDEFIKHFDSKNIKRKTSLLKAGKIVKEIYFLKKGCIRLFYEKNGEDISAYFFTENMFAGVNANYKMTTGTYKKILAFCKLKKTIYLPTHDENAGQRLLNKSFILDEINGHQA
jgi:hypothetical protein